MSSSDKIAFPKQLQPWPGFAREITPRHDHGEKVMQRFGTDTLKGLAGRPLASVYVLGVARIQLRDGPGIRRVGRPRRSMTDV